MSRVPSRAASEKEKLGRDDVAVKDVSLKLQTMTLFPGGTQEATLVHRVRGRASSSKVSSINV